jgi:hemerythrin
VNSLLINKVSFLNDEELDISEILEFLVDWLVIHIKKTDKQYSAFLNSKGVF